MQRSPPGAETGEDENSSKMKQGLQLFLDGLSGGMGQTFDGMGQMAEDAAPALRDLFARLGPAWQEVLDQVKDFSDYEAPQILPNGDILIRRKEEAPEYVPAVPGENEDGSVDL
ncbi:hypothetical protein [Pseudooceanicola algae]|uniref:Uncharacterized protein n=1 Tax=Pseudooceanicola algae TaxID=1537215 RepID=A0A418SJI7_9RHOB|nr:hypothetical protein [Pseudooceanicola algae]QPM91912.1 hypothetical protein PSAL_031740 [Pseudooceanicola algae]